MHSGWAVYRAEQPYAPDREEVAATADDHAHAHAELAALALEQGRSDTAREHLEAALAVFPENAELQNHLGRAMLTMGRFAAAIEQYRFALRVAPGDREALNNLAWLLATREKISPAEASEAVELAGQLCAGIDPLPLPLADTLAAAYAAAGRFDEAVATLEAVLPAPSDPAGPTSPDPPSALAQEVAQRLALYRREQRFHDDAGRVLRFHPAFRALNLRLGVARAGQGDLVQARRHLLGALAVKVDADVLNDLGLIERRAGRIDDARRHFLAAVQMKPDWTPAVNNLAWTLATWRAASREDRERSVVLARRICAVSGFEDAAALDTLSVALASAGRFAEAESTARRALAIAGASGASSLAGEIEGRLRLFAARRPFRE